MAKRKTSGDVKKMRIIILAIALVLVLAVVGVTWFTLSREAADGNLQWQVTTASTTEKRVAGQPDEETTAAGQQGSNTDTSTTTNADGLPYDKYGSDMYAEWNGKYPSAEVIVKKGDDGKWSAFVGDKKVPDCTGVYCNEYGWWFVRDGDVDYNYTGIAGNEKGKWYIEEGKANFHFNGTFTADRVKYYTIVEGEVIRES